MKRYIKSERSFIDTTKGNVDKSADKLRDEKRDLLETLIEKILVEAYSFNEEQARSMMEYSLPIKCVDDKYALRLFLTEWLKDDANSQGEDSRLMAYEIINMLTHSYGFEFGH